MTTNDKPAERTAYPQCKRCGLVIAPGQTVFPEGSNGLIHHPRCPRCVMPHPTEADVTCGLNANFHTNAGHPFRAATTDTLASLRAVLEGGPPERWHAENNLVLTDKDKLLIRLHNKVAAEGVAAEHNAVLDEDCAAAVNMAAPGLALVEPLIVAHEWSCDFPEDLPCTTANCQIQAALDAYMAAAAKAVA